MERFRYYAIKLSGIIVLVFFLQIVFASFTEFFVLNESAFDNFEFWRFLSAIFLHGSIAHLFYNLFALAFFGSILEKLRGGREFLIIFFISGILANVISVNFYSSSLGASGAIFGVVGALIVIRPLQTVWAFGLPMPIFIAGIFWGVGDIIGAVGFFTGNPIDNTGNLAHLSGMFFGLIFGFIFRKKKKSVRKYENDIDEGEIRIWEDRFLR